MKVEAKVEVVEEPEEHIASAVASDIAFDPTACSCVRYAHYLNPKVPLVDASWFSSFRGKSPSIGGIIILQYPKDYHIATIVEFVENGFLVKEANYKKCEYGKRIIDYDDPHIIGFWNP